MHKIDNSLLRSMQANAMPKHNAPYKEQSSQIGMTTSLSNVIGEDENTFEKKMRSAEKSTNTNKDTKSLHQSEEKETSLFAQTSLFSTQARQNTKSIADNGNVIKEQSIIGNSSMVHAAELVEKLSQTILVSMASRDGTKEIHIHLKNDILPQTEVQLKLDGKNLEVQFVTHTTETSNFLSQHAPSLQNILQSKQDGHVSIAITLKDQSSTQQSSEQNIVHKGSETSNDNSGDGRSRQQRNIFEELLQKRL